MLKEKFDNIDDAVVCLAEWKTILGLHDWSIKIKLVEPHEFELNDVDGECEFVKVNKCAVIRILKPEYYGDRILKYCAERILVHELLHCKFALLETDISCFNSLLHQTIEDLARALICAKYSLSLSFFENISYSTNF